MSFKDFKPRPDYPAQDNPVVPNPQNFIDKTNLDNPVLASLDYTDSSKLPDQGCQQDRSREIREMLTGVVKNTNANYCAAKDKAQNNPLQFRKDRALRRIRPMMSADRYTDTLKAISHMDSVQLLDWVNATEKHLRGIANGHS